VAAVLGYFTPVAAGLTVASIFVRPRVTKSLPASLTLAPNRATHIAKEKTSAKSTTSPIVAGHIQLFPLSYCNADYGSKEQTP